MSQQEVQSDIQQVKEKTQEKKKNIGGVGASYKL